MIFELKDCGGCRTCEMACSFKFTGNFNYQDSAFHVINKEDGSGYLIELVEDPNALHQCDGCEGLDEPMCVQFCHFKDELRGFIQQLMDSKKEADRIKS